MSSSVIFVFDVDGTLTPARQSIDEQMLEFMTSLRQKHAVAIVGGSDLAKIAEQLSDNDHKKLISSYDYVFAENGLVAFKGEQAYKSHTIQDYLGEDKVQKVINFALGYFSKITLPVKRGNFIEFRSGMLNLSPIGRSCSQAERNDFVKYDTEHKIREQFVQALEKEFEGYGLTFAIGGQISVDVFPNGWDKTFCLQYFADQYEHVHFFGDKTMPGGNDHAIFSDPRTIGHTVTDPSDTRVKVQKVLDDIKLD